MALPAPHLDDRRFQQFVDDAKRYVQQACPEWSDHNVSDPGVTLIEAVAHMADQIVYRLNRVPEKNQLAFLDLLGITLFPPAAAAPTSRSGSPRRSPNRWSCLPVRRSPPAAPRRRRRWSSRPPTR